MAPEEDKDPTDAMVDGLADELDAIERDIPKATDPGMTGTLIARALIVSSRVNLANLVGRLASEARLEARMSKDKADVLESMRATGVRPEDEQLLEFVHQAYADGYVVLVNRDEPDRIILSRKPR